MYFPKRDDFYRTEESVCSNFDGVIHKDVVEELKNNNCESDYPAWEWHGMVWHTGDKFHIRVKRYGSVIGEHDFDTFEELQEYVCEAYGDQ